MTTYTTCPNCENAPIKDGELAALPNELVRCVHCAALLRFGPEGFYYISIGELAEVTIEQHDTIREHGRTS